MIKVVESNQQDISIAFMYELAMMFDHMNIDTAEVINGMGVLVADATEKKLLRYPQQYSGRIQKSADRPKKAC